MSITSSVANGAVIVPESTRVEYRAAVKARKNDDKRSCSTLAIHNEQTECVSLF
ncbi:FIG00554939: hypothetical protein [Cronobacter sakazakii 680]|nr:FIG00554939: hypothetical protein [Cronobacter sakazakii 680]